MEKALLPSFEKQDREHLWFAHLLILVPEKTRQAGCEFKARLRYMRDLRSDSVFKRKMERKKRQLAA